MRKLTLILLALALALSCSEQKPVQKVSALPDEAWKASEWISVADAPVVEGRIQGVVHAAEGANWFVSNPSNEKKVNSAVWMTTGLGVYLLYVNGQPVGEEVLKPGFTHAQKTKRSYTYDVTSLLDKASGAANQLAAQVTPGWWGDKIVTPGGHEGMVGKKCAFRGVLKLTYTDGSEEFIGTNTADWKAGVAGPVKLAGIFDGEVYDAREKQGFETPEKLTEPVVNTEFQGEILPSEGAEIYLRKDLTLKPVRMYVWKGVTGETEQEHGTVQILREYKDGEEVALHDGETLVVDFGQNAAAVPSFVFKAGEGTELTCLPGEILNDGNGSEKRGMDGPEGSVHRRNLRVSNDFMKLQYVFGGEPGFVEYTPQCTFYGYRFISVTASADVSFASIASIPVTSIAEKLETGTISTGNDLVNQIISNTVWGQRSNYLSVPTDCPQRDERLGWMADTQVFTETGTFFANTRDFFHKWTRDVRDSQSETGAYPGVAPTAQYGNDFMRLGWADAGIIVPWTVWKQFGDKAIVEENWASMERFMDHIAPVKYDHSALISENGNYQWADWLSYEALESCTGKAFVNEETHRQAGIYWSYLGATYWYMDACMMRDMAAATGRTSDAAKYEAMAAEAHQYLKDEFLNQDGSFKLDVLNTMQTPALFALKNGLVEGEAKEAMKARLLQNFHEHGDCLQTGFLGTAILLQTLTDNGMADMAYTLLYQRNNPSWIYSIDNGATTIWERWNSYRKDTGLGPVGMNSFNHYAYGSVCEWIWETAAGIACTAKAPGFRQIVMKPVPDKQLGHLDAVYESAAGTIESHWKYEGEDWVWTFKVPSGAKALVTLPGESDEKTYESGTYTVRKTIK